MKRWFFSLLVTPKRARKAIAWVLSKLIYRCIVRGTWSVISSFPPWLRKMADFIESWNATELPKEKDKLIADLVADAVTDEAIDRILSRVTAMKIAQQALEVR